jgi:hypothetical protein
VVGCRIGDITLPDNTMPHKRVVFARAKPI